MIFFGKVIFLDFSFYISAVATSILDEQQEFWLQKSGNEELFVGEICPKYEAKKKLFYIASHNNYEFL